MVSAGLWSSVAFAADRLDLVAYVGDALAVIEREALRTDEVDWLTHRESMLARAEAGTDMQVAHDLIEETLELLGDGHSFLRRPVSLNARSGGIAAGAAGGFAGASLHGDALTVLSVYPGSPAEVAGLVRGDRIVRVNGVEVTPDNARDLHSEAGLVGSRLVVQNADGELRLVETLPLEFRSGMPPAGYWFSDRVAVLELPQHSGSGLVAGVGDYAELAHAAIGEHVNACGWIVDLRLNHGGNMWPMLAAAGPLLGEGLLGSFIFRDGEVWEWSFADGNIVVDGSVVVSTESAPSFDDQPPVAVLTGGRTSSSGEAVTVAFRGAPGARSFGEATHGVPTSNRTVPLPDGAFMQLTVARFADRTGRAYDGPLEPDEFVPLQWELFSTVHDPVFQAAEEWLLDQPECSS